MPRFSKRLFLSHLIIFLLISITIFGQQYKSRSPSLCSFHHSPVTSSVWGPNISPRTLFSNTPSLYVFPPIARDEDPHPYETSGTVVALSDPLVVWYRVLPPPFVLSVLVTKTTVGWPYVQIMYSDCGILFQYLYRASFVIFYCDQQTHSYFTNYHTATCFDTVTNSWW